MNIEGSIDRLSSLPRELIDCILKHLPIEDAAKTIILSKTWRNIWPMHPHLSLLYDLFIFSNKNMHKYSTNVHTILELHTAPILDFHLVVHPTLNIHYWINHISNKGVRNLVLVYSERYPSEIPSHLFHCSNLTYLRLVTWILTPPFNFGGFRYLIKVELEEISIMADMSFGPQLEVLQLIRCTGIEHLRHQFMNYNNLKNLFIAGSKEIECQWFTHTQNLDSFGLMLEISVPINLNKLLANMSNISSLYFGSFEFLESHPAISKRLTTTMEYLTYLHLCSLATSDLDQVTNAIRLLRSSPNLRNLSIFLIGKAKKRNPMELTVEEYMRTLCCTDMILVRLEAVKIRGLVGSRAQLHFIKLLLASSPSLTRMSIIRDPKYNYPGKEPRITRDLMSFHRASSAAQIIWTENFY